MKRKRATNIISLAAKPKQKCKSNTKQDIYVRYNVGKIITYTTWHIYLILLLFRRRHVLPLLYPCTECRSRPIPQQISLELFGSQYGKQKTPFWILWGFFWHRLWVFGGLNLNKDGDIGDQMFGYEKTLPMR